MQSLSCLGAKGSGWRGTLLLSLMGVTNACSGQPSDGLASAEHEENVASQSSALLGRPRVALSIQEAARAKAHASAASASSANPPINGINYHGGEVMRSGVGTNVYTIWYGDLPAARQTVLRNFLNDVGNTAYWDINATYYQQDGHRATKFLNPAGETSVNYTKGRALTDSDIFSIVTDAITAGSLPPDETGIYLVFTASDVTQTSSGWSFCGEAPNTLGYCGWHNSSAYQSATLGSFKIRFAFIGDPTRCPNSCITSEVRQLPPNGDAAGDGMVSVTAHELTEAISDPNLDAWYRDSDGEENADICAWTFGDVFTTANGQRANVQFGAHDYYVQQNWVNERGGYCALHRRAPSDVDDDGRSDIILSSGANWTTIPVAHAAAGGGFTVTNASAPDFASWAQYATPIAGDFDGDHRIDVALIGGPGWYTLPVAFSTFWGGYNVTNLAIADFAGWATVSGAKPVVGDFDGNGRDDIALVGGQGWNTVPIAFSNGDGTFSVTNSVNADLPVWAVMAGATPVGGDFDGDGRGDIALVGGQGWTSIPVAYSNGDGTFDTTNQNVVDFPTWATVSGATPVSGDFNGDGWSDIALVGGHGWSTVPVAFSNGNGNFGVSNTTVIDFPSWATLPGVRPASGDFNGDGLADIALVGGPGWNTIPVALRQRTDPQTVGSFDVINPSVADFPSWAVHPGAMPARGF